MSPPASSSVLYRAMLTWQSSEVCMCEGVRDSPWGLEGRINGDLLGRGLALQFLYGSKSKVVNQCT